MTKTKATPSVDQRLDGPGISHIDPDDPAARYYDLLARLRSPLTLRQLMIQPVRTGYIGQDQPLVPADLPPGAAVLYPDIAVSEIHVPSPAGPIRCQVFRAPDAAGPMPLLLYIHGGGFTVGSSEDTAYITSRIARETGLVVVSVNYRLAPEWPFPAGLDDCFAVLGWLRQHGSDIGGNPETIAVGGDSSGGNIAAALPLKAVAEGARPPEAAVLLCPLTDFFAEQYESFESLAPLGIVYDTAFFGYIRGAYAVHHRTWSHPHASPARGDLRHYPPALIVSGTKDPMIDDNLAFAEKLRAAGNEHVEMFVREDMPHGYYFFPGLLKEGDEAFAAVGRFLQSTFPRAGR
nr:alpha/beta hydrolase [uncultured Rhodopila sp.]